MDAGSQQFCVMAQLGSEPCHNCRRKRLKCDRSIPQCFKCTKRGQECLGYQLLLRWDQGVASRGKMMGITFEETKGRERRNTASTPSVPFNRWSSFEVSPLATRALPIRCLADPLLQDLNPSVRQYVLYCKLSTLLWLFPTTNRGICKSF